MSVLTGDMETSVTPLPMYWQILMDRVSDMSMFDSRHSTQRHADKLVISGHVISHHIITLHHISIHADTDADAADTQSVTSQPEISRDIT